MRSATVESLGHAIFSSHVIIIIDGILFSLYIELDGRLITVKVDTTGTTARTREIELKWFGPFFGERRDGMKKEKHSDKDIACFTALFYLTPFTRKTGQNFLAEVTVLSLLVRGGSEAKKNLMGATEAAP